ncbi:MAG: diguanylate cyclase [Spirochaetales bacterium]
MDEENISLSVLAVDDEPINLKLLETLLRPLNLNMTLAEDGTKGFELMSQNHYDLLLFDIMMPGIDGLELCRLSRQDPHHKDVPVLILTSMIGKETLLKAFEAGAVDFLTKPFHGPELIYRVKAQLKLRTLQRKMETFANELNLQILKAMKTEAELMQSQQALSEANRTLADWAHKDTLTGLWNRRKAWDLMDYEAERSNRQKRTIGVAIMDLDKFKSVNDTLGHDVGDTVLKTAAEILANNLRKGDILARWGGEEFLLVFPETELEGSLAAANKMRAALEAAHWELPGRKGMTVSVGVTVKQPGESWDTSLKVADEALYRAKENGRNRVEGPVSLRTAELKP